MRDDAPPIRLKLGPVAAAPVRDEAVDSCRQRSSNDSHRVLHCGAVGQQRLHPVLAGFALAHQPKQVIAALGADQLGFVDAAKQMLRASDVVRLIIAVKDVDARFRQQVMDFAQSLPFVPNVEDGPWPHLCIMNTCRSGSAV